jgi:hypothetical protein
MGSRDDFARIVRWRVCCAGAHLLVAGLAEGVAEPLQTLVKTVTGGSASRLDVLWKRSVGCTSFVSLIVDVPRRAASGSAGQACQ